MLEFASLSVHNLCGAMCPKTSLEGVDDIIFYAYTSEVRSNNCKNSSPATGLEK